MSSRLADVPSKPAASAVASSSELNNLQKVVQSLEQRDKALTMQVQAKGKGQSGGAPSVPKAPGQKGKGKGKDKSNGYRPSKKKLCRFYAAGTCWHTDVADGEACPMGLHAVS